MKLPTTSFIVLVLFAACAARKKPPSDDSLAKHGDFECFGCLRRHAPQCIPRCFPSPQNKKCVTCLVTAAVECLEDCNLPKTAQKIDPFLKDTCDARPDAHGVCVVAEDNCDAGTFAVPSKFPLLQDETCFCSCDAISNDLFIKNLLDEPVQGSVNVNLGLGVVSSFPYTISPMGNTTVFARGQLINITARSFLFGGSGTPCATLVNPTGQSYQVERLIGGCRVMSLSQTSVETVMAFEENGEKFEQKDSYNPDTKEAIVAVPAHGDFPATTFIMQGRSSNSPAAGKMIVSTETECSLEDLPDEIAPENMMKETNRIKNIRQTEEVKIYRIQSDTREVTEEEQENLSESMKRECAGKIILVSSVETIKEDEFLARNDFAENFRKNLKRVKTSGTLQKDTRMRCQTPFYGCALTSPSRCVRWTYDGYNPTGETGLRPLIVHLLSGSENYCATCCPDPGTVYPQCSCISEEGVNWQERERRFSTAFAISWFLSGEFVYDCIKRSNACKWSNTTTISECNYTTEGSCILDRSMCPRNCAEQENCN